MTDAKSADRRLLRAVYCHLDIPALQKAHPELDREAVIALFRRLDALLDSRSPAPSHPATAASRAAASTQRNGDTPPATGKVTLYCDGGSRGNPGIAAYGISLVDAEGKPIAEGGECIGHATNNVAEYHGLVAGLRMAAEHGITELLVRSDSELMVHQLNGRYRVKSPNLAPLFAEAQRLLKGFRAWKAEHIPRALNRRADALANEAMDRAEKR